MRILAAISVGLLLSACSVSSTPARGADPTLYGTTVELPDGRTVTCVVFDPGGPGGAIDCDFGTG